MKKVTTTLAFVFVLISSFAQQFSDNFDSYTSGSYLGPQSPFWTTRSGVEGGDADALVSSMNTYSSSNSIYLHDQTNNGTAQLIRLNVGQVFEEGVFTFETALNVSAGQSAIISLMGNNTNYNSLYTFHCQFTDGQATSVSGGTNENLPVFSYPQGTWFRFKVEANLTLHLWKVYVNENLVGFWTNPVNKIACIDFMSAYTSTVNYEFYIDNVHFINQNYSLSNLNAIVSLVKMDNDLLGEEVSTEVNVLNAGEVPITSFDLNLFYQNQIIPMSFSGLNIQSLETFSFEVPGIILAPGDQTYIVKITNVNGVLDDILEDNILSGVASPIVPAPGKMVVGEEITGTWCQWCVRGIVFMNQFEEKYDPYWCGIVIHSEDPMNYSEYMTGMNDYHLGGFPRALIDRWHDVDPSGMSPDFFERVQVPPVATIVNGATWDSITRLLHVSVTSNFVLPAYGNYKVACVLTEDEVTGSGPGWSQRNAYAGGNYGVMGGFETLSDPVPSSTMVYDHVARAIAPSFTGMPNSFPNYVQAGESYTTSLTFTLPAEWDETKINIIGMILDPTGKIDNAGRSTIAEAVANGYVGSTAEMPAIDLTHVMTVSPNPASTSATVHLQIAQASNVSMRLLDFAGKVLSEKDFGSIQGHYENQINTSNYKAGVYFVELTVDGRTTAKKLIVE